MVRAETTTCCVLGHGSGAPGDELNSRASFERVRSLACDGVELDVRRTLDDGLAVIHDPLLPDGRDVTTTATRDLPADVMLLADVLDLLRGMLVNVEIKNHDSDPHWDPSQRVAQLVVDLLAARDAADRVIVSSFGIECMDEVRRLRPELDTAQLLLSRRPAAGLLDAVVDHGHAIVHPYESMVDARFMDEAHARGLTLNAWTAEDDSEPRLAELIRLGVDGLITGAPERAARLLRPPVPASPNGS